MISPTVRAIASPLPPELSGEIMRIGLTG